MYPAKEISRLHFRVKKSFNFCPCGRHVSECSTLLCTAACALETMWSTPVTHKQQPNSLVCISLNVGAGKPQFPAATTGEASASPTPALSAAWNIIIANGHSFVTSFALADTCRLSLVEPCIAVLEIWKQNGQSNRWG